jgi:hypothetical protein
MDTAAAATQSAELDLLRREMAARDAKQVERDDNLSRRLSAITVSVHRSAAGSATNTERWTISHAKSSQRNLSAFFQPFNFLPTGDIPALPVPLTLDFQEKQRAAHLGNVGQYEVKVTQPTFMNAIALAASIDDVSLWLPAADVPDLRKVELKHGELHMFVGSQCWIRGRLSPDFGLFAKGYRATEFSAMLIGEADNKASVKAGGLTDDHKGENLLYQREVLERCPFRMEAKSFVYSFLTNNRTVQFLRSKVVNVGEDGLVEVQEEASQEVDMGTGWPYLWQLLNASPVQLGHTLPEVRIGNDLMTLASVVGVGAQGACYAGKFKNNDVIVKLGAHMDELWQERRVLGALLNHESDILTATVHGIGSTTTTRLPDLCDGKFAVDADAQKCIPSIVAYGPGVLILGSVGKPFDGDDGRFGVLFVLCTYFHKSPLRICALSLTFPNYHNVSETRTVRRACETAASLARRACGQGRVPHGYMPSPFAVSHRWRPARD